MKIRGAVLWVVAFATIAIENVTGSNNTTTDRVCRTAACADAASELSKSVNLSVDPCIDFHEFACGGFLQSLTSPEYMSYRKLSDNRIWKDIDQLLISAIDPKEPRSFKLVKTFYKSCVDEAMIEAKSLETFGRIVHELGGWPVVDGDSWTGDNFDWRKPFYMFLSDTADDYWQSEDRLGYLIHFRIPNFDSFDLIDSIQSSQGAPWTLDPNDFNDTGSRPYNYYESLINMAVMLGADSQRARTELLAVMEFEKQLAAIKRYREKYSELSIIELNTIYDTVPWITYLQKFFPPGTNIFDDEIVAIYDPDYYVELETLMASTPKRVQANYIMAKIVLRYGIYSTRNMSRAVETALGPYFNGRDRRTYCRDETMTYMWRAVTTLYADKYFSKEMKHDIDEMSLNIQAQMIYQVKKNGERYWTEREDRKAVANRLEKMNIMIGYPTLFLNIKILNEFYENLNFTEDDYLGNMKALSRYDREMSIKEIMDPNGLRPLNNYYRHWRGASIFTTMTHPTRNIITIGNEYIRDLYYGIGRPKYMNYGGLGNVIAHQVARMLFEDPSSVTHLILGLYSRMEFEDNAECLDDQNKNSRFDNLGSKLKGAALLKRNLADGTRLVYDAYKNSVLGKPKEPKLPGFEKYSDKQMFWLNLASVQCEKFPPQKVTNSTAVFDEYSIPKSRLIRMIANMPEFAKDFNCTATPIVNPVKQC